MTVTAARTATISAGGTPTAMTGEACSSSESVGAKIHWQITEPTKRAIDPGTAITVYVDATPTGAENFTVDYVNGIIDFGSPIGDDAVVTIDGKYIPLLSVSEASAMTVQRPQAVFADVTRLGDAAARLYEVAKKCEVQLDHMHAPSDELDTGISLESLMTAGEPIFLAVDLGSETLRGWFMVTDEGRQHGADEDVQRASITFKGVVRDCVGRTTEQALFSITSDS